VVVSQGDTYETAVADVKSAIKFHLETFGSQDLGIDPPYERFSVKLEYPETIF
jgi:predicted RNase H-like HicB family nuclease